MSTNMVNPTIEQLPSVFLSKLEQMSAISISGEEKTKYLQGQITCDLLSRESSSLTHGAHCNAKGKIFSVFRLLEQNQNYLLLQPKSTITASLAELKKFGVFAKVDIEQTDSLDIYLLAGTDAEKILSQHFTQLPNTLAPVVHSEESSLVYISGEIPRYLLLTTPTIINNLLEQHQLPCYPSQVWDLLEINDGFANFISSTQDEYIPQMLNLQAINAISFTKGCYLGQETVARMQYLGKNKKALFSLKGYSEQPLAVETLTAIEKQLGENWRKAGDIISYYQANNGELYIQAVLAKDLEPGTQLRLKHQPEVLLEIKPLPYSLNTNGQ